MPIFEKKREKPEIRALRDIVLDMLAAAAPEAQIRATLLESGLAEAEADDVLAAAKAEYSRAAVETLGRTVEEATERKKAELLAYLDRQVGEIKKDVLLAVDLRLLDQKAVVDKTAAQAAEQLEGMRTEQTNLRLAMDARMKELRTEVEAVRMRGPLRPLLAVLLILVAAFVVIFSLLQFYTFFPTAVQRGALDPGVIYLVLATAGMLAGSVILAWLAVRTYIGVRRIAVEE